MQKMRLISRSCGCLVTYLFSTFWETRRLSETLPSIDVSSDERHFTSDSISLLCSWIKPKSFPNNGADT